MLRDQVAGVRLAETEFHHPRHEFRVDDGRRRELKLGLLRLLDLELQLLDAPAVLVLNQFDVDVSERVDFSDDPLRLRLLLRVPVGYSGYS